MGWVDSGNDVYITSGKVGIGTTAPDRLLHISSSNNTDFWSCTRSGGATLRAWLDTADAWLYTSTNNSLVLGSNNAERMRITGAGNVGIGTTSPTTGVRLEVMGISTSGGVTAAAAFRNGAARALNNAAQINLGDASDWTGGIRGTVTNGSSGASRISLLSNDGTTGLVERVHIDSDGSVRFGNPPNTPNFGWDNLNLKLKVRGVLSEEADDPPDFALRRHAGTYPDGTRAAVGSGVNIGVLYWQPYGSNGDFEASSGQPGRIAEIVAKTAEAPSGTARAGKLILSTTSSGNVNPTERLVIHETGTVEATGDLQVDGNLQLSGSVGPLVLGWITSSTLSTNQNNFNPSGFATAVFVRLIASTAITITGLSGGIGGRLVILINLSNFAITLADEGTGSSAANRFDLANDQDLVLGTIDSVTVVYDSQSERWREIARSV